MARLRNALLLMGGLLVAAPPAEAAAVDDANAAVKAAREGKYEEAIDLFTRAINTDELNLRARAQAYAYRGIANAAIGDYDHANEDLNFSVVLGSDYSADALAYRGYFRLVQGDAKEAAADLVKSAEQKVWAYNAIWLHLARAKAGLPDDDTYSLAANAMKTNADMWPHPVIRYLMGQATPDAIRKEALNGDPARYVERICDVDFYIAEAALAKNDAAAARPLLQAAADKCPFASFERMGATAELARLK
jgi:lipoprotein NlpI